MLGKERVYVALRNNVLDGVLMEDIRERIFHDFLTDATFERFRQRLEGLLGRGVLHEGFRRTLSLQYIALLTEALSSAVSSSRIRLRAASNCL